MNRRSLLAAIATAGIAPILPAEARDIEEAASALPPPTDQLAGGRLWVRRDDTVSPEMDIRFRHPDTLALDRDACLRLSWFWRDIRDHGQAVWIDPSLFDLLGRVQSLAAALSGRRAPVDLLSGYRTPERNRTLEGAARRSMHIFGRAADIRLSGFTPAQAGLIGHAAGAGGVGLYSRFTHLDTGRRRAWGRS